MALYARLTPLKMIEALAQRQIQLTKRNSFASFGPMSRVDNYLILYGFRGFRTTHLLNLRFLEDDISKIDHKIYQAGLKLDLAPANVDKLGLRHGKRDRNAPEVEEVIDQELLLKLRELIEQYSTCKLIHERHGADRSKTKG